MRPQENPYLKQNDYFYNVLNYALVKKDFEGVKYILSQVGSFTKDNVVINRISKLFFNDQKMNAVTLVVQDPGSYQEIQTI